MMNLKRILPLAASTLIVSISLMSAAFAETASTASSASASPKTENGSGEVATSTSSVTPRSGSFVDSLYLNYFATFHGAPLNDLGSPRTVDQKGKPSKFNSINFDSEITAAYLLAPGIGVGPAIPFLAVPVLGQGIILGDLGVKAFNKKTISYKGFNLSTNLILQAPTSKSSQARQMDFAVKTTPALRYSVPASRFTVGAWTEAKAYLGVIKDKTFKLYAAPYANYQLIPNLSLNLEYEMEWHHDVNRPTMDFATYQTDLQPGFVWNVTRDILVNPYVQISTTQNVNSDRMAVGAVISATVL